jgi:tetratricopeptide (TPR) repeat protein
LRLAEYVQARERYEEALPIYRDIGARLGEANCIKSLGDVHVEVGDEAAALAAWQAAYAQYVALGLPSEAANTLTSQANLYDRRREYDQSLELYTQAIALAPANPMWYRNRASCYINLKDAAAAAADLATAETMQPGHPYLALRRGDLALLHRDPAAAAAEYRRFMEYLPENNGGYWGLALALLAQGKAQDALAVLEQYLARTYAPSDVRNALDDLAEKRQDWPAAPAWDEAAQRLQAWLQDHPTP